MLDAEQAQRAESAERRIDRDDARRQRVDDLDRDSDCSRYGASSSRAVKVQTSGAGRSHAPRYERRSLPAAVRVGHMAQPVAVHVIRRTSGRSHS
jgi:hypothetical protein